MSVTVTTPPDTTAGGSRLKWAIADSIMVMWRNLMRFVRIPALFVFSIVQPLMFVLLFRFVLGGNITNLPPGVNYVNYLMPGIFVQTAIFGATNTGVGLAEDLASGIVDRFRSLPMARSAVLVGRTLADFMRNLVVVVLMVAVGYLVGFKFTNGFIPALAAIGLTVFIGFSFSWVSATIGLAIREVESVQAASFTWIFPLTFISSALFPVIGFPPALRAFARNNPVTIWADTVRTLTVGAVKVGNVSFLPPAGQTLPGLIFKSTIWMLAILIVFVPLSVRMYRKNA
jgi:ABC-2 type transport system permease protein/oleandomycin transport system permease protein